MFNVYFQWTGNRVLWCLLLFTVHRTWISGVFLPHTHFVNDYSAFVDSFSSHPCLFFSWLCCPSSGLQWLLFVLFFFFFYVVLFTSPSLSLCYIVKLTSSSQQVRVQILFLVDITWLCFLGSGFLWEGRNANVSTLYNDGQLCIYCLFIVDLYMKRNEYIIYIYISIHNEILWSCFWSWKMTFHGPYVQSALFRVLLKAPFTVLGYRRLRVE